MKPDKHQLIHALNESGIPFETKVLQELRNAYNGWEPVAQDYPVAVQSIETKADIVLKHDTSFAVVECKRLNPNYTCWMFLSPGNEKVNRGKVLSRIATNEQGFTIPSIGLRDSFLSNTALHNCGRGVAVRIHSASPSKPQGNTQQVEDAMRQVLAATAGVAQEEGARHFPEGPTAGSFIPVIVTTAPLFVATYEPEDVSLATGRIDGDLVRFGESANEMTEVPSLLAEYHLEPSRDLEYLDIGIYASDISSANSSRKRSVVVVNSMALKSFFSSLSP